MTHLRPVAFLGSIVLGVAAAGPLQAGTGDLDPTFGAAGVVTGVIGAGVAGITDMVRQSDGKLVALGETSVGVGARDDLVIARFLDTGTLDTSFGTSGTVTIDVAPYFATPVRIGLQSDGAIVTTAIGSLDPVYLVGGSVVVVRVSSSGVLDATFDGDGIAIVPFATPRDLLVQADDKLVVAASGTNDTLLMRFDATGALDPTFAGDGVTALGYESASAALAQEPDDDIVLASSRSDVRRVTRVLPNGTVDPTFGTGGLTTTTPFNFSIEVGDALIDPAGNIVVAGVGFTVEPDDPPTTPPWMASVARFDASGALDPTFGTGGEAAAPIDAYGDVGIVTALEREPSGHLVVAGTGARHSGGGSAFGLVRFDDLGRLDPGFGFGGRTITPVEGIASIMAAQLRPDGRLVVAGQASVVGGPIEYALAQYDLACPALPDTDGDAIGDACDPCTTPIAATSASLKVRSVVPPAGDEFLVLKGRATLPVAPPIDPANDGIRLIIDDALGLTLVDVWLPPYPFAVVRIGWKASGRRFDYRHLGTTSTRIAGIDSLRIRTGTDGTMVFRLKARGAAYQVASAQLPLTVRLILAPPRSSTHCVTTTPSCAIAGTKLFCEQ